MLVGKRTHALLKKVRATGEGYEYLSASDKNESFIKRARESLQYKRMRMILTRATYFLEALNKARRSMRIDRQCMQQLKHLQNNLLQTTVQCGF